MTGLDAALRHLMAALAAAVLPAAAKSGGPDKEEGGGAFRGGAPGFAGHLARYLEEDRKAKDAASHAEAALAHPRAPAARKAMLETKTAHLEESMAAETVQACNQSGPDCFPAVCAPDLTGVMPHILSSGIYGAEASGGLVGHNTAACRGTKGSPQFKSSGQEAGQRAASRFPSALWDKPLEMICSPRAVRPGTGWALTSLTQLPEVSASLGPIRRWCRRLAPDDFAGSKGGAFGTEHQAAAVPAGTVRMGSPQAGVVPADDVRNAARHAPQVQEANVSQGERNRVINSAASVMIEHPAEWGGLAVIKQETHHVLAHLLLPRHAPQSPGLSNPISGFPAAACQGGTASRALAPLPAWLLNIGSATGELSALRGDDTPWVREVPLVSELASLSSDKGGEPAARKPGQLWAFTHASPRGKTNEGSAPRVLDSAGSAPGNERTDPARFSSVSAFDLCKALRREAVIAEETQEPGLEEGVASHALPAAPLRGLPPCLPSRRPGCDVIQAPRPRLSAESVNLQPPGGIGWEVSAPAASEPGAARDSQASSVFPRLSLERLAPLSSLRQDILASLPVQALAHTANHSTPSLCVPLPPPGASLNLARSAIARLSFPLVIVANRFEFPDSIEPYGAQQPFNGIAPASRALLSSDFLRPDMAPRVPAEEGVDPACVQPSGTKAAKVSNVCVSQSSAAASGCQKIFMPARATRAALANQQLNAEGPPSPAVQVANFVAHSASEQISGMHSGNVSIRPASRAMQTFAAVSALAPMRILQLQLEPNNLGRITVRLRLRDGRLDVRLDTERSEAMRLISQEKDLLARTLMSAGYVVNELEIRAAEPQASQLKTGANSPSNSQEHSPAQAEGGQSGHNSRAGRDDFYRPFNFAGDDAQESFCSYFSGSDHLL